MKICSFHGCGKRHYAKGFCELHYNRNRDASPERRKYRQKLDRRRRESGIKAVLDAAWKEKNPDKVRLYTRLSTNRRRAIIKNLKAEYFNYQDIFNWDSRICHICKKLIENLYEYDIDHIIPLSRGGTHELANLSLAHPTCNRRKSNKLLSEMLMV